MCSAQVQQSGAIDEVHLAYMVLGAFRSPWLRHKCGRSPFSQCRCVKMSHALIYPTENVGKIMRSPVLTINPGVSLRCAAQLMEEKNVGSVVVVEDSRPTGILTERDFVRLMAKGNCLRQECEK